MSINLNLNGYVLVSKNLLEKKAGLHYCVRREAVSELDTGWIFFSRIDDDEYSANGDNFEFMTYYDAYNTIEPIIALLADLPVGSDVQLCWKWGHPYIADSRTGKKIEFIEKDGKVTWKI